MSAQLRDVELPRPGRDVRGGGAGRRAREELSVLGHRTVSVRSADQRRHHAVLAQVRLHVRATTRCSTAKSAPASTVTGGMPLRDLAVRAHLHQLRLRGDRHRVRRGSPRHASGGNPGDPVFGSLDRGPPHREPRQSDGRLQHGRSIRSCRAAACASPGTFEVAGGLLGGTTDYIRPDAEVILYIPHTRRTVVRPARAGRPGSRRTAAPTSLPYYRRFFLGGETQIRGVDIRTVGPLDSQRRALGGDKFLLFNAEYYFDIASMVRALVFHDAGQAYAEGDPLQPPRRCARPAASRCA